MYRWPIFNDLNASDQNGHRILFSISGLKKSQFAQEIHQNSRGIISRQAFRD